MLQAALLPCQQLTIQTAAGKQVVLARADIEALPHIQVATGASGSPTTCEGVALRVVKDGKLLDDKEGRYRIVIPDEKGWPGG